MSRSIGLLASAALLMSAGAAQATPTAKLSLTSTQFGVATTTVKSGGQVVISAGYEVTNLAAGQSVHLELDLCGPALDANLNLVSGGSAAQLTTCHDGQGDNFGQRVSSPTLSAGSSSTGITGTFILQDASAAGLSHNGDPWIIPGRIVLDGVGGGPLQLQDSAGNSIGTSTNLVLTISAAPKPQLVKNFTGSTVNSDGTTDVTWVVWVDNNIGDVGVSPLFGTTTIVDPVTSGGTFLSSRLPGAPSGLPSAWTALSPNSNLTISSPSSNPSAATITIDNAVSDDGLLFGTPTFYLTYRYPASADGWVTNTAYSTYPGGSHQTYAATALVGPDNGGVVASLLKYHFCLAGDATNGGPSYQGYDTRTANLPNLLDNPDCFWAPESVLQYEIVNFTQSLLSGNQADMTGGDLIDTLPAEVVLSSIDSGPAGWHAFYSDDSSCTTASSWTPVTLPFHNSTPTGHCVRFTQDGGGNSGGSGYYTYTYSVKLGPAEQASLESQPGAYLFVDNSATLTGDVVAVNGTGGTSGTVTLTSTFWNAATPKDSLTTDLAYAGNTSVSVGHPVELVGFLPFVTGYAGITSYEGFHHLSFGGTLPPELDITGAPTLVQPGVDSSGNPLHLACTVTPQNHATSPVTPASYQCEMVDGSGSPVFVPSYIQGTDPFTQCSPPDYCGNNIYEQTTSSVALWNEIEFTLPTLVVTGIAGQVVTSQLNVWSTEGNTVSTGLAAPGSSQSNPAIAKTSVTIAGLPQLKVQTAAATNSVVVGSTESFLLSYKNTGNVATGSTFVYDILGYDATSGQPLTTYTNLNCTGDQAVFAGVQHVSGAPPSTVQYTTDDPGTLASVGAAGLSWSSTPPSNLATVTGVRFELNSEYTSAPGDYSPNDDQGVEQISLVAPNDPGSRLCSMGAISAAGLTIAGSIDLTSAVQILTTACTVDCNPTPVAPQPQTVATASDSCGAPVTLDATGSTEATTFSWYEGSTLLGSSTFPTMTTTVVLNGLGQHGITLVATDSVGIAASASTTVTVVDQTPPQLTCSGPSGTVTLTGCSPDQPQVTATVSDNCDGSTPTVVCGNYQPGGTSVSCTATDSSGNTGSCTVPVTIVADTPPGGVTSGDEWSDTNQPLGPNGGFCDDANYVTVYFTLSPGCIDYSSPTASISYVDSSGVTQTISVWSGSIYLQPSQSVPGQLDGQLTFSAYNNNNQSGAQLDFHGAMSVTISGAGGSQTLVLGNSGFEPCDCHYFTDNGQQMLLFEDLWPDNGDLDFNDQTIIHDFSFTIDQNYNYVTGMRAQFNVVSIGATLHNGLYVHLPGVPASAVATIDRYFGDGTHDQPSLVPGESEAVFEVVADTRTLYGNAGGYLNTEYNGPTNGAQSASNTGEGVTLVVTFAASTVSTYDLGDGSPFLSTGLAPYDTFIARTGDYGHQIHQVQFPGTPRMNSALFGQGDDASDAQAGTWFINHNGLPFALNIPEVTYWSQERFDISHLFGNVKPWFASGGTDYTLSGWYADTSVNPDYGVQVAGAGSGIATLPIVGPQFGAGYCPNND